MTTQLTSIELCAGAGGQAIGLERAGFRHLLLVDNDHYACETLRANRRGEWNVLEASIERPFSLAGYRGEVDLLAAGIPCPPFSKAGMQLGKADERDLFPALLRLVEEVQPRAVMIENVRGILDSRFDDYRKQIHKRLRRLGFESDWQLHQAADFGVPQLRPRAICVALPTKEWSAFKWPKPFDPSERRTVGETLVEEMASGGWPGADEWARLANRVAPTLVGGSKKHGGPDLGPTRAKREWAKLGVDGHQLANEPPAPDFSGMPRLTVRMAALLQGFPPEWEFSGKKTASYRQVGNAFPPPVAEVVGRAIKSALRAGDARRPAKTRKAAIAVSA